jgi:membrane associated rhomboid family serine protease
VIPLKDENPTRNPAVLTVLLILVNVGVFLLVQPRDGGVEEERFHFERAAIPCELTTGRALTVGEIDRTFLGDDTACHEAGGPTAFPEKGVFLSVLWSMFFHADWLHLGFNMLFLWIFGNNIEDHMGVVRFAVFYVLAGVAATTTHVALGPDSTIPMIGASGAIAGVMGAYLVRFPDAPIRTVFLFFFIFIQDVRAKWLLAFWFVSQFFIGPNQGVAWAAHVGGFVFGALVALLFRMRPTPRRMAWRY